MRTQMGFGACGDRSHSIAKARSESDPCDACSCSRMMWSSFGIQSPRASVTTSECGEAMRTQLSH